MKLKLDKSLMARLSDWAKADIVLDYDQSIGENLGPVDGCAIGTRFRLVAIDQNTVPKLFSVIIDSDLGPVYFKKDGETFLTKDMTLTQAPDFRVELKDDGALIDSNVKVVDLRTKH